MAQAPAITRTAHAAGELGAERKSSDAAQVRRLLAIAFVLDGDIRTRPRSGAA